MTRLKNEPALIYGLVEAVIALVIAFGLNLDGDQVAAIMAVVAILTGVGVRQTVYGPETANEIMDADAVIAAAERGDHEG